MLKYNEKAREKAIENLLSKRKMVVKSYLSKRRRGLITVCVLFVLCVIADIFVSNVNFEQFMAFKKVTPKNLTRLSEDAFRKIIGYGYEEKIYIKDTSEIRARLEADSMIFGNVKFFVKLIPYELEIEFREANPLFVLLLQRSDSVPLIYSDKDKLYPYGANVADLPVVDAKKSSDISLATNFLAEMKKYDASLYSRVSQLIPREDERQITVFFKDVDFRTIFSLERDDWRNAFRHYRQLTGNMQVLNINSLTVLDLRFKRLAYITEKDWRL